MKASYGGVNGFSVASSGLWGDHFCEFLRWIDCLRLSDFVRCQSASGPSCAVSLCGLRKVQQQVAIVCILPPPQFDLARQTFGERCRERVEFVENAHNLRLDR